MNPRVVSQDGAENRDTIQRALDETGRVVLPSGRTPITGGLVLRDGMTLRGARGFGVPRSTLVVTEAASDPVIHVRGSRTRVSRLGIEVPAAAPGIHDGARWTAITVGDYLYPEPARWIEDVRLTGLRIRRATRCAANTIAVMGAVRDTTVRDVEITGGGTGVAVHWGAVGSSVAAISGPSYHPHHLVLRGLRVDSAFEGFYLSSVHDVAVTDVRCADVEIGFRLLPGDNADRFHEDPETSEVSRRISVSDCTVQWRGPYAVRVAGWGRSEVDRAVRTLAYRDVTISSCAFTAGPQISAARNGVRATVVVENAESVRFAKIDLDATPSIAAVTIDGTPAELHALLSPAV
jgi:hypothetical protein